LMAAGSASSQRLAWRPVVYAVTMQVAAGWAVHRLVTGGGAR
jgi:hypothetical protein